MTGAKIQNSRSLTKEKFVKALEEDDFESQYEILRLASKDAIVAEKLLKSLDEILIEGGSSKAINWELIRQKVRRVRWSSRLLRTVTDPSGVIGRAWIVALTILVPAAAAASALLVRDALGLPFDTHSFRGTIFLAMVCLGLTVLSAIALMTVQFGSYRQPKPDQAARGSLLAMGILQVSVVGLAATAIVVLAVATTLDIFSTNSAEVVKATVSPNATLSVEFSPKSSGVVTVEASKSAAEISLRLFDSKGEEIRRKTGYGVVRADLRRDKHNELTAVVSASEVTSVSVSTTKE